jgi:hypothetical protein
MNNKIIGILVCMLMIILLYSTMLITSFIPNISATNTILKEAYFEVEIIQPRESKLFPLVIRQGWDIKVIYRVKNTGDSEGTDEFINVYEDGFPRRQNYVSLKSGETYKGSFSFPIKQFSPEDFGECIIKVGSTDDSDQVLVLVSPDIFGFGIITLIAYWLS